MTNNNTFVTLFDQLATETLLEIFEYLSLNDIINIFFNLNQRFNSILLYQRCTNYLKSPTRNLCFWQNILLDIGSNIPCLIITTNDLHFSLNLFPNLKSIIISSKLSISHSLLYSLFENEQFNQLYSFKIQSEIFPRDEEYKTFQMDLFKQVFHKNNSLKTFECLSRLCSYDFEMINNWKINESIHKLSLKIDNCIYAIFLLQYTLNVKSFKLIGKSFPSILELNQQLIDLSKIKLKKIDFIYERNNMDYCISEPFFLSLKFFIEHFSLSLVYLSINLSQRCIKESDTFHFNGIFLQQEFLQSMIELKEFHFYALLYKNLFDIKNRLLTFESSFWFDHDWLIGMHENYIYTLPFHYDQIDGFIGFEHIHSSSLSKTWYHVKSINLPESYTFNSKLIKQLKVKMPKLSSITLTLSYNIPLDNILKINTTLESVTTVCLKGSFGKHFQQWLIYVLPNLKHLILPVTYDFIETKYEKIQRLTLQDVNFIDRWKHSIEFYFPNLKYAEIELVDHRSYDFMKVLKSFNNCKTLILYLRSYKYYYENQSGIDVNKIFNESNLNEIRENYEIKYGYNSLEFTRKNNELYFSDIV